MNTSQHKSAQNSEQTNQQTTNGKTVIPAPRPGMTALERNLTCQQAQDVIQPQYKPKTSTVRTGEEIAPDEFFGLMVVSYHLAPVAIPRQSLLFRRGCLAESGDIVLIVGADDQYHAAFYAPEIEYHAVCVLVTTPLTGGVDQIRQILPSDSEPVDLIQPMDVRFFIAYKHENGVFKYAPYMFEKLEQFRAFLADSERYSDVTIYEQICHFEPSEKAKRQALLDKIISDTSTKPIAKVKRAKQQA